MKKLLLPLLLCGLIALLLCACNTTPPPDETLPDTTAPVTEAPTDPATEPPTEESTETPTEETTEAPTEEPTEAPTEESTEAPTTLPPMSDGGSTNGDDVPSLDIGDLFG